MPYLFHHLTAQDEPLVWRMLYEAAHLADEGHRSPVVARRSEALARYAREWGRPGDLGIVAVETIGRSPVGAAWLRLWAGPEKGYAFLDEATPELAIGVVPDHRNRGIGTELLRRLILAAAPRYAALSLSVRVGSPAVRLYRRLGFEPVPGTETPNRVGGQSVTMKLALCPAPEE